jgi:hypothetical protein
MGVMADKAGGFAIDDMPGVLVNPCGFETGTAPHNVGIRVAAVTNIILARGIGRMGLGGQGHVIFFHENMLEVRAVGTVCSGSPRFFAVVAVMAVGTIDSEHA